MPGVFLHRAPNGPKEGRRDPDLRCLRLVLGPPERPTTRRPVEELHAPATRRRREDGDRSVVLIGASLDRNDHVHGKADPHVVARLEARRDALRSEPRRRGRAVREQHGHVDEPRPVDVEPTDLQDHGLAVAEHLPRVARVTAASSDPAWGRRTSTDNRCRQPCGGTRSARVRSGRSGTARTRRRARTASSWRRRSRCRRRHPRREGTSSGWRPIARPLLASRTPRSPLEAVAPGTPGSATRYGG